MQKFLERAGRVRADVTGTERADLGGLQRLDRGRTGDGSFMLGGRDEHDPIRRRTGREGYRQAGHSRRRRSDQYRSW